MAEGDQRLHGAVAIQRARHVNVQEDDVRAARACAGNGGDGGVRELDLISHSGERIAQHVTRDLILGHDEDGGRKRSRASSRIARDVKLAVSPQISRAGGVDGVPADDASGVHAPAVRARFPMIMRIMLQVE
jgi:hypothetical protein